MEFVYVVKRYDLFDRSFPHGFVATPETVAQWTRRIREKGFYLERRQAELDSSFKQIIPYTLVMHGDEILLLRRRRPASRPASAPRNRGERRGRRGRRA